MCSWKMDYYHYQAAERHEPGDQRREPNLRETKQMDYFYGREDKDEENK